MRPEPTPPEAGRAAARYVEDHPGTVPADWCFVSMGLLVCWPDAGHNEDPPDKAQGVPVATVEAGMPGEGAGDVPASPAPPQINSTNKENTDG